MRNSPTRRRLTVWIACFAILLNALAPSISHAISSLNAASSTLLEICTVDGAKYIAASGDAAVPQIPAKDPLAHHVKHCPFCAAHPVSFALTPPSIMSFALVGGHDYFPPLFYQSPQPLFSWAAAN